MPDLETLLNIETEVTQVLSDLGVTTKLNEMDDFMNQNELKVQITNENTAVTGLVTYTCTVKDKNNTALANRVVEWYKGTTLLGLDATDSNGISTFSHRVSEADIYDVHAVVRGTHAGDDIRMFVKDKNNLATFARWSCGEYSQSLTTYSQSPNTNLELTTEYSHTGNNSIKATPIDADASVWIRTVQAITQLPFEYPFTAKAYVKCVNCSARLTLQINYIEPVEGNTSKTNYVTIPADTEGLITISNTVDDNVSSIQCQITMSDRQNTSIIYLDTTEMLL